MTNFYNEYNNNVNLDDFANMIENACNKMGWKYDEKFGFIYIHTKYESWCFELTTGKIKLMHKNTRYTSNGDYHLQWRKFVTAKYLINYINNHGKKKYLKSSIKAYA